MKKTNFTSHKQYLFGLLFSRNAKETHADQSILQGFVLQSIYYKVHYPEKTVLINLEKKKMQKTFSSICMLLVPLVSMNVFYSMR